MFISYIDLVFYFRFCLALMFDTLHMLVLIQLAAPRCRLGRKRSVPSRGKMIEAYGATRHFKRQFSGNRPH